METTNQNTNQNTNQSLDLDALKKDINRLSTLHSWYKHLSLGTPTTFYCIPAIGEQPRNTIHPSVDDKTGIHWYFFNIEYDQINDPKIREIVETHTFTLNPFFYHDIYTNQLGEKSAHGSNFIYRIKNIFEKWINNNYPDIAKELLPHLSNHSTYERSEHLIAQIFEAEFERMSNNIISAATKVHEELKAIGITAVDLTKLVSL